VFRGYMTIMKIRTWPDPILSLPTKSVDVFSSELASLVASMAETMYAARGAGLAAPQVGSALRIFVMDTSEERTQLEVFVNPIITGHAENTVFLTDEGCLSFPDLRIDVNRYPWVEGTAQNINGEPFSFRYDGFKAQCVAHEIDHLDGIVMIDHLNRKQRMRIKSVLKRKSSV